MTDQTSRATVVVGVDGSTRAQHALDWAASYADRTGATLRVVAAWDTPHFFGRAVPREGYEPAEIAHELVEKALADVDLPADRVSGLTPMGPPGEVLVDVSADADLLVVGAHGHRLIPTLLLGSTAGHCLHHAACTVAIIR